MGMGITITINHMPIHNLSIVRRENFKGNDKVHEYRVRVMDQDKMFLIKHRYSDGALVLARIAIEAVMDGKGHY